MRLQKLELSHFKGIEKYNLDLNGQSATVRGKNSSGKTSLADAYVWLSTGQASNGDRSFSPKPLSKNGAPIHHLDSTVEGVFDVGGRTVTLKRTYKETWQKKRGSAAQELTGHTTAYEINGAPTSEKEYVAYLEASFKSIDRLKMLILPGYFASDECSITVGKVKMPAWQNRRNILSELAGDISDDTIFAENPELAELSILLDGATPDEAKKAAESKMREIDRLMKSLPLQIEEAEKAKPELGDIVREAYSVMGIDGADSMLAVAFDTATQEIEKLRQQRASLQADSGNMTIQKKIVGLQAERMRLENEQESQRRIKRQELSDACMEKHTALLKANHELTQTEQNIAAKTETINTLIATRNRLLERQKQVKDTMFDGEVCPTCDQAIPADKAIEVKAKINVAKSTELESIAAEGSKCHKTLVIEPLQAEVEALKMALEDLRKDVVQKETEWDAAREVLAEHDKPVDSEEVKAILAEIARLEASKGTSNNTEAIEAIDMQIADLQEKLDELHAAKSKLSVIEKQESRIQELLDREKSLAIEYEQNERISYMCREYSSAKARMLSEHVNGLFKSVSFRLFDTHISTGEEYAVCDCLVKCKEGLIDWNSANTASKVNAGIEVIERLSAHFGISMPVFIDGCESVTDIRESNLQLIKLKVDENYETLTIELEDENDRI